MKTITFRLGTWGASLGILAGLVEILFGVSIRPWIGNKENPVPLGLATLLLSGLAWAVVHAARKQTPQTPDGKLALVLGVFLPASLCFTTVGRLWYLPGLLLFVTMILMVMDFWRSQPAETLPRSTWRWIASLGGLVGLLAFGLAFWQPDFALFHATVPVSGDRLTVEILPMDAVRRTVSAFGMVRVEVIESGTVMATYLLLLLGAGVALIASLASSRLFSRIGAGLSLSGTIFFILQLPGILVQTNFQSAIHLWSSLGWGWYLSLFGAVLTLLGAIWRVSELKTVI